MMICYKIYEDGSPIGIFPTREWAEIVSNLVINPVIKEINMEDGYFASDSNEKIIRKNPWIEQ